MLILSAHPAPDFLRESVVHGFRQRLGVGAVDFIQPLHLREPRLARPSTRRRGPNCMATASPTPIACATTRASTGPML